MPIFHVSTLGFVQDIEAESSDEALEKFFILNPEEETATVMPSRTNIS